MVGTRSKTKKAAYFGDVAGLGSLRLPFLFNVVESGWRAELAAKTTELLGRFGVAGRVEVEGKLVWLIGHGPTVEVGLPELVTTSAAQSPAELERLAERVARDLAAARRNAVGKDEASSDWLGWLKLLPPIVIVLLMIGLAARYLLPPSQRPKALSTHTLPGVSSTTLTSSVVQVGTQEKRDRDYRTCIETVTRIQRGGSVSALDSDGWVVELSLISDKQDLDPASAVLKDYMETRQNDIERTQRWSGAPSLLAIDPSTAGILVSKEPLAMAAPTRGSGIKVTWRGQYASQYFKEDERREFINLSDSLYLDAKATYGALYARCAQGVARYLGSWFRGPTVGGSIWSLMAEMDVFADVPQIPNIKPGDSPEQWAPPLNRLAMLSHSITRKQAAFMLANYAGSVSESPGQYGTLVFPFAQGFRANTASQKFINSLMTGKAGAH